MTYVDGLEPRLVPVYDHPKDSIAAALLGWLTDLTDELDGRLPLIDEADVDWQPHPESNSVGVTVWHVSRWLDVLGSRAFTGRPAAADAWHQLGWVEVTGYEPEGIGYRGLGTLTGYTVPEMLAVPQLDRGALSTYLGQAAARLRDQISALGDDLVRPLASGVSPYQHIATTIQGSFGHMGEIDALVSLRARLSSEE